MDQIVSRELIRAKGAAAFDKGLPHDGHQMNPGSPAIDDWQLGWRQRRDQVAQERYDRLTKREQQAAMVTP